MAVQSMENPTDRGAWQAAVHVVAKESGVMERLKGQKLLKLFKHVIYRVKLKNCETKNGTLLLFPYYK